MLGDCSACSCGYLCPLAQSNLPVASIQVILQFTFGLHARYMRAACVHRWFFRTSRVILPEKEGRPQETFLSSNSIFSQISKIRNESTIFKKVCDKIQHVYSCRKTFSRENKKKEDINKENPCHMASQTKIFMLVFSVKKRFL